MSKFDYDQPSVPDSAVTDVAAEIANNGKPPPLSELEIEQRKLDAEVYLLERRRRDEQQRVESQRKQAVVDAEAERQAAILAAKEREEWRRDYEARQKERRRDSELVGLRIQAAAHEGWRQSVERAAYNTVHQRHTTALMGELEKMLAPAPPPEPVEPDVVVMSEDEGSPQLGSPDFNPDLWKKI